MFNHALDRDSGGIGRYTDARPVTTLLELAGLAAIVYGVHRVSVTAAVILAGVFAVTIALAIDRGRQ